MILIPTWNIVTQGCPTESLPYAFQIVSIIAFLLTGDILFKALLYIGVDPQSEHEMAPTPRPSSLREEHLAVTSVESCSSCAGLTACLA